MGKLNTQSRETIQLTYTPKMVHLQQYHSIYVRLDFSTRILRPKSFSILPL